MSNFTPAWFKKGFFNESLFCDDFLSTHQLLYSNGAFFTPDGRMVDPMPPFRRRFPALLLRVIAGYPMQTVMRFSRFNRQNDNKKAVTKQTSPAFAFSGRSC